MKEDSSNYVPNAPADDEIIGAPETAVLPTRPTSVVLFALVAIIVVALGGYYLFRPTHHGLQLTAAIVEPSKIAPAEVAITNAGFVPASITVAEGQALTWTNSGNSGHVVTSDPYPSDNGLPGLNSEQIINPGSSYSFIFTTAGTYTYHDNLNPTLKGVVIVK